MGLMGGCWAATNNLVATLHMIPVHYEARRRTVKIPGAEQLAVNKPQVSRESHTYVEIHCSRVLYVAEEASGSGCARYVCNLKLLMNRRDHQFQLGRKSGGVKSI